MPLLCWMFEPTYTALDIYNIHRKIKNHQIFHNKTKYHFFFSPIFFQLIFLRPLSRLRNFLISFTIHKIRSLSCARPSSLTTQTKKNAKNATITTTPREVDNSSTFLATFFAKKNQQIQPSPPPQESSRFYQLFSTFLAKIIF